MSRYTVERAQREGEEIVILRDGESGAEARVWPACGNNCFSLLLPPSALTPPAEGSTARGTDRPLVTVIQDPPALDEIRQRPSWWGIPLLFPFPGSMPGGAYEFEGRRLRLGRPEQPVVAEGVFLGESRPTNARRDYHGFVMDLPWRVATTEADDAGATVRSALDSADYPEAHEGFPFPYRVEAMYRLDAAGLRLDFHAINTGSGKLPFAFGAHPFFKLPLGAQGAPGDCLICIPASRRWNARGIRAALDDPSLSLPSDDEIRPQIDAGYDLSNPKPFVEQVYNGIRTALPLRDGLIEALVRDPLNGRETVMRATPNFQNVVFWSPPGRSEICFEPWTAPSNAFNLAARGVSHHGLIVLNPGETWQGTMWIALRDASSPAAAGRNA